MSRARFLVLILSIVALASVGAAAAVSAATYTIDTTHSSVLFEALHFETSKVYGRFNDISGTIDYDSANPAATKVKLTIDSSSVDTANTRRDDHLRSPDFFNAKQFPAITFESKSARKVDADTLEVVGDLTMLGVAKEVTLTVDRTGAGSHPRSGKSLVGFETRPTIKRSDFGMSFMVGPVSDEIDLIIAIEAGAE